VTRARFGSAGTPAYTLRQVTNADFLFMREAKFDGMRPYVEAIWGWNQQQQEQIFADKFDATHSRIVVVGGVDAGFIHVMDGSDSRFLAGIFLTAPMRRRGLGSVILRDLMDGAAAHGQAVTLRVLKVNPARNLYKRLGFTVTGETDAHFLMRWTPAGDP